MGKCWVFYFLLFVYCYLVLSLFIFSTFGLLSWLYHLFSVILFTLSLVFCSSTLTFFHPCLSHLVSSCLSSLPSYLLSTCLTFIHFLSLLFTQHFIYISCLYPSLPVFVLSCLFSSPIIICLLSSCLLLVSSSNFFQSVFLLSPFNFFHLLSSLTLRLSYNLLHFSVII